LDEREPRPILAVSACLLGESVRYDGRHKRDDWVCEVLSRHFHLQPLCPEVGAGLGVPRPSVRLVRRGDELRAVGVEDADVDVTESLAAFTRDYLRGQRVDGMVLKARSPSCALDSAPVDEGGETGPGLFTARVVARWPWLPVIEENGLADLWRRLHFVERAWIGFGLRSGRLGCLRPSWVYRLQGRGPGGIDQDPARSLEEALARPWQVSEIARQGAFLCQDPRLPEAWRERLQAVPPEAEPALRLGVLLAALAALDGDARGEALFLAVGGQLRCLAAEGEPC